MTYFNYTTNVLIKKITRVFLPTSIEGNNHLTQQLYQNDIFRKKEVKIFLMCAHLFFDTLIFFKYKPCA